MKFKDRNKSRDKDLLLMNRKEQQKARKNLQWNSGKVTSKVSNPTIAKKRPLQPSNKQTFYQNQNGNTNNTNFIKKKPVSTNQYGQRFGGNETYNLSPKPHRIQVPIATTSSHFNYQKGPAVDAKTQRGNIKVVVRVRPPNFLENKPAIRTVLEAVDDQMIAFDRKQETSTFYFHGSRQNGRDMMKKANKDVQFNYDRVFGPDNTNYEIFEAAVVPLIDTVLNGFNCSVFAYGATGSGKTYTMIGSSGSPQPGLIRLTLSELYQRISAMPNIEAEVNLSFMEVYNEFVTDLLEKKGYLQVREVRGNTIVSDLAYVKATNCEQALAYINKGNSIRAQQATEANKESSRSHAILQITILLRDTSESVNTEVRRAKLVMVDLAGSERGSSTSNDKTGERFREGSNINKSLLALGNCINALADGKTHIPYRDSKLTRILRDALGGNCKTVMIANVSPSELSYEDSYNTLKYADRAKHIRYNLSKTEVSASADYSRVLKELKKLKEKEKLCRCLADKRDASTETLVPYAPTPLSPLSLPATSTTTTTTTTTNFSETIIIESNSMNVDDEDEDELMMVNTESATTAAASASAATVSLIREVVKQEPDLAKHVENFVQLLRSKRKLEELHLEKLSIRKESECRFDIKKRRVETANLIDSKAGNFAKAAMRLQKQAEILDQRKYSTDEQLGEIVENIETLSEQIANTGDNILEKVNVEDPFKTITFGEYLEFENAKANFGKQRIVDKHNERMIQFLLDELSKSERIISKSFETIQPLYKIIRYHKQNTSSIDENYLAITSEILGGRVHFGNLNDDGDPNSTSVNFNMSSLVDYDAQNSFSRSSSALILSPPKKLKYVSPPPSPRHRSRSS